MNKWTEEVYGRNKMSQCTKAEVQVLFPSYDD